MDAGRRIPNDVPNGHRTLRTISERMSQRSRFTSATMAGTPLPATTRRSALCPKDLASQTAGPSCTPNTVTPEEELS